MSQLVSKRWLVALSILSMLLVLSGCQQATTQGPTPTAEVLGPGSFNLPAPMAGLSDLSSYRATLYRSFEGTLAGQPAKWSRTYVMLTDQSLPARQVMIEPEGDAAVSLFAAEVNGALYQREGEDTCNATVSEEDHFISDRWEPAGYLFSVMGAEPAGTETVNGVPADHYTFDERAIGAVGVVHATGEVWVASEGGYIVKYILTTEGGADFFGEDTEGTATLRYALTDANQPVTIELPVDCPEGMIDVPLLPDATNVVKLPGMDTYSTATSIADAAAFYQEQLPALGWQVFGLPMLTETTALLEFTQDGQQLSVIITATEGVTNVRMMLGSANLEEMTTP